MKEITEAIEARQAQITQLQGDIETLQRAASIMGTKSTTATRRGPRPWRATGTPTGTWQSGRSRGCLRRHRTNLLHQAEKIQFDPEFDKLAIADSTHTNCPKRHGLPGRCDTLKLSLKTALALRCPG